MKKMTDRPRIEMGEAPEQAKKLAAQQGQLVGNIDRAIGLCGDPSKTNSEVASAIGVTRRQVSRLRHGSQAAWNRLV
jgi:hypothetical protein